MKFFAAITVMLGFSAIGFGQTPQNASNSIAANATVVGSIAVGGTQTLEFGNLSVDGYKTISLAGVASGAVTGGTERQGYYTITKGANTSVDLSFTSIPTVLTITGGGTNELPITYLSTWGTSSSTGIGGVSVNVTQNATTIVPQGTAAGTIYVHLAGTVTPDTQSANPTIAGSYTANVTLKAEFN